MFEMAHAAAAPPRAPLLGSLVAALSLSLASAADASVVISPLRGTPDASPATQISFLGVPAGEISGVSVTGSSSGRHSGRLAGYATAAGASFLPARPFAQGERVTASATVGPRGHTERVSSTFYVARPSGYRPPAPGRPGAARPGTVQSYVSAPSLHPPVVAITTSAPGQSPGDIFLTPTHGLGQSGPMIVDGAGRLLWYQPVPTGEVATNLQVQSYRGAPALVWWQGSIPATLGVGFGQDEIYSTAYKPIATVSGGNGYQADLHDFQLTPQGSAFVTAYTLIDADLSSVGGSRSGILQDGLLQEIDIPTGLVMFEWHAYGHVELDDSYSTPPRGAGLPWDFFHINSISLDTSNDEDFIVSSRNTWAAYEIDHRSGAIMWRLGGRHSSFKMGAGTGTAWQHDVRWQSDHTLTIFDNGAVPKQHSQSRAIRERIDWAHRKVNLVGRYVRTPALLAGSQGNVQVLADGSSFVGWGEAPNFTEFGSAGQVLFDGRIPLPGQSYRAFRYPWSAAPAAPPALVVKANAGTVSAYMSWNGATGVAAWRLLAGAGPTTLSPLATSVAAGFETVITAPSGAPYFAVQALDASGGVLGTSAATR